MTTWRNDETFQVLKVDEDKKPLRFNTSTAIPRSWTSTNGRSWIWN